MVDDYAPWRDFVCSTLRELPIVLIVGEASDGLEAVQKAQEFRPDLILLDLCLPKLNGIEAARQTCECFPQSKIIIVSENRSSTVALAALRVGALGYVVKSRAATELLPAVEAVLQNEPFMSTGLDEQI